ncbi:putative TonB system transport protein ExbD [Hyphomonas johnsonii MHS-2]|uniref:Putative TonB system transport protein ExbD n=2 Tax=Hyphomonas johnsonii TaxID=81031 RepID=A0A059FLX4_9PROT|nr:putative TonB system transport protein ExbD [Hyphomonas johnsonii MHS-2]
MTESHVDLTPMLDVVFILLIFFIVTATFAQEDALGLEPPPTDGTADPAQKAMVVAVAESGVVTVDGRPTDIGSVRANIERVRAASPDVRILIKADPKAKSGTVVLIRDAAYAAGYTEGVNFVLDRKT